VGSIFVYIWRIFPKGGKKQKAFGIKGLEAKKWVFFLFSGKIGIREGK
jgi:hypothetical protein